MDPAEKRIVLEYSQGRLNGIFQIVGVMLEPPPFIQGPFQLDPADQIVDWANLVKVTPRAAYYKEMITVEGEAINEFYPENH